MKLTKFEHACFIVEKDGKVVVVDPGIFTSDFTVPENVVGVVVTHEHTDHFDPAALGAIIAHNPDAIIYAHENVVKQLGDTLPHQAVSSGEAIAVGPFQLEFFGGEHAVIHPSMPVVANLGVMIDDLVYYPGDSFTLPKKPVDVLALPVSAPWLKISEVMDYLTTVRPRLAFPTHDAVLSEIGKTLPDRMVPLFAESYGGSYQRLTEPLDI
ncbi:MAG: hypothetical protein JWM00_197 [Candidatus Saccharibacteria bacterium]|nr:hypothetical protein [Candidatus Saccharibacteria bacterium]